MLDLRIVREKSDEVEKSLARRHGGFSIASLVKTDSEWRALQSEHEDPNRRTNEISQQFKTGQAADKEGLRKEQQENKKRQTDIKAQLQELQERLNSFNHA